MAAETELPLASQFERWAVVVDDSTFARTMIASVVQSMGFSVASVGTANEAMESLDELDPELMIIDLDLGDGPSGLDLINVIRREAPWVAMVVITAFRSPRLLSSDPPPLDDLVYLVKSELESVESLTEAVSAAMIAQQPAPHPGDDAEILLTPGQADLLRLMAHGLSNPQISEELGISRRAVEHACRRMYRAMGIDPDSKRNARVEAVRMFRDGRIDVRARGTRSAD